MTWENKADKRLFKPAERKDGLRGGKGFGIWEKEGGKGGRDRGPRRVGNVMYVPTTKYVFAVKGK